MANKIIKSTNWLNIALSVVALILECIPRSVIKAVGPLTGPDHYNISYHSYFTNPADWNVTLMFAFIVAILTVMGLIFNILLIIKNEKAIYIISLVIITISFLISTIFLDSKFATNYNYFVMALFLIQTTLKFLFLSSIGKETATKINLFNILGALPILIAFFLERMPRSIRLVQTFTTSNNLKFSILEYKYFDCMDNWISILAFIVAIFTFCMLIISFIIFSKDNKGLCITQLAISSICGLFSIIILIMAGSSFTPYNVVIMLLFIVLIINYSVKLKTNYNVQRIKHNQAIQNLCRNCRRA